MAHNRRLSLAGAALLLVSVLIALGASSAIARSPQTTALGLTSPQQLAAGSEYSCAVDAGRVLCWGDNSRGELGNTHYTQSFRPVPVEHLRHVVAISGTSQHTCALRSDGTVWCWGWNAEGQLGNGSETTGVVPTRVAHLTHVVEVSAGDDYTCALLDNGRIDCWGADDYNQLGHVVGRTNTPRRVRDLPRLVAVSAGFRHTCAITRTAHAVCWGADDTFTAYRKYAQTPDPVRLPVAGVATIAAEQEHTCLTTTAGRAWCSGSALYGQIGNGKAARNPVNASRVHLAAPAAQIDNGNEYSCARRHAALFCWGFNSDSEVTPGVARPQEQRSPVRVAGLTPIADVATGPDHVCALARSGVVLCWGEDSHDDLGRHSPVPANRVFAIRGLHIDR